MTPDAGASGDESTWTEDMPPKGSQQFQCVCLSEELYEMPFGVVELGRYERKNCWQLDVAENGARD